MTAQGAGWLVSYQRCAEYEIVKCPHVFDPRNPALLSAGKRDDSRRFVVVDENVERLHASEIRDYFDANNITARILALPAGEQHKSPEQYFRLLKELDAFPIDRRDEPIIAIGGGVLTDLVGFAAGTFRRGVPHIKVPTTLIGYVDAAVGVKSGINFDGRKNRLGAFVPPARVLLDPAFLQTLPTRHILNGLDEIIKLAVIADLLLFEMLESDGAQCIDSRFQHEAGAALLDRAIQGMIDELSPNLFEENLSRRMDFGHTFSYGLETAPGSEWLHGEAVLMDVLISSIMARNRVLLPDADLDRLLGLVRALGVLPDHGPLLPDVLWASLEERTLHRNGWQRVPLPHGLGNCTFVNDLRPEEVRCACDELMAVCRY